MEQIRIKDALKDSATKYSFETKPLDSSITLKPSEEIELTLADESIPMTEKSRAIYTSTSKIIDDLFKTEITAEKIQEAKLSINSLITGVVHNKVTISSLIRVSSYDYYTYTHCVNVAVYSVGLAKEAGLSGKEQEQLGMGGILHDLGKAQVDLKIVNKAGALTEIEFKEMKRHPVYGYNILKEQRETDEVILTAVRHHHEKLNGVGYPDSLLAGDISLYARIVAICDIFDALSTKRSYKPAMSSFDTLNLMQTKMKNELDPYLLKLFIKMMGRQ
jgi:putative nucleotidyltransferase with HDIG domain